MNIKELLPAILLAFVITCIILIYKSNSNTKPIISRLDGNSYHVIYRYANRQQAADLLAQINSNLLRFMKYLKAKYHVDETDEDIRFHPTEHNYMTTGAHRDVYMMMNTLLDNYNYETIYENDPLEVSSDNTSYTINKGDRMYLCLRNPKNPEQLIDYNTLMFCLLHEASHVANYNGWGHQTRFWTVFKLVLYEASAFGIYYPVDYEKYPVNYCSLTVNYQPLYDATLPRLWEL